MAGPEVIGLLRVPVAKPSQIMPSTGRPMLHNADGSVSTEESITVIDARLNNGMPTNIPSIWGGKRTASDDEAVEFALQSGQTFPAFGSLDEAVAAAIARSEALGRELQGLR